MKRNSTLKRRSTLKKRQSRRMRKVRKTMRRKMRGGVDVKKSLLHHVLKNDHGKSMRKRGILNINQVRELYKKGIFNHNDPKPPAFNDPKPLERSDDSVFVHQPPSDAGMSSASNYVPSNHVPSSNSGVAKPLTRTNAMSR